MAKASGRTCDSHAQSSTALTGCGSLLALTEVGVVFVTGAVGVCDRTADVNPIIEITSAYKSLIIFVIFSGNKVNGLPVRALDVHQRPCKNRAKAASGIEPLRQRVGSLSKECCTLSEVEHAMLVSAQTDRLVLGKNATYCKSKRCNAPLDAVVNEVISCGQDYSSIAF